MKWIRTETGKLVNLAHHSEIKVVAMPFSKPSCHAIVAYEPSYTDTPCVVTLCEYPEKAAAEEALADLFDWLSEEPVGCDFSAAKAGA